MMAHGGAHDDILLYMWYLIYFKLFTVENQSIRNAYRITYPFRSNEKMNKRIGWKNQKKIHWKEQTTGNVLIKHCGSNNEKKNSNNDKEQKEKEEEDGQR